jgi:L-histidine N-alpha-methyltransferase
MTQLSPLSVPAQTLAAATERIRYVVRSDEDPLAHDLPNVICNLTKLPKKISSVYVYDQTGTALFEQQCATPEYYLRRVETELLRRNAGRIFELCGPLPMVELGAGTAEKTRFLLEEYDKRGLRCDYFPIDVDCETLAQLSERLVATFPFVCVHCVGATYEAGLRALPARNGARLFLFLGSSIGNMEWSALHHLLAQLFANSAPGDYLLLGADLDKDPAVIDRAYNDSAGYGPRSTLNVLEHLNHRYGGNFIMQHFRYRSKYDPRAKKNEVRIESLCDQTVTLAAADFRLSLEAGELIDAEVMLKFDPDELGAALDRAGFAMLRRWIDPVYRYGLFLLRHR